MIPFHNALSIAPGEAMKTYAEFQDYIATLAVDGDRGWSSQSVSAGWYRWTAASPSGPMTGSPWGPSSSDGFGAGPNSRVARVVQHGLPSGPVFDAQVSGGLKGLMRIESVPYFPDTLPAVNRNGFNSSSASGGGLSAMRCTRLDYFDPVLGPMTMNPSTGTGPTPLSW